MHRILLGRLAVLIFTAAAVCAALHTPSARAEVAHPGIEVFFTNPPDDGGIRARLTSFLGAQANTVVYMSFYDFDGTTSLALGNTLLKGLLNRGCTIYIYADQGATQAADFTTLTDGTSIWVWTSTMVYSGLNGVTGGSGWEMHNKFIVVRDSAVWGGSWNMTDNDSTKNNNNVVLIYNKDIARVYEKEFKVLYASHAAVNLDFGAVIRAPNPVFGSVKRSTVTAVLGTPSWNGTSTTVNGAPVAVYFCPYDYPNTFAGQIVNNLQGSATIDPVSDSVYICMFANNNGTSIDDTLVTLYTEGRKVVGIFEGSQSQFATSMYNVLKNANVPVALDGNPENLHHKFAVLDPGYNKARVITGSANWTSTANSEKDENVMIIQSTGVARLFYQEFQRRLRETSMPSALSSKPAIGNLILYPNPARDATKIGFELGVNVQSVNIRIYTLSGEIVRGFTPTSINQGVFNEVDWDVRNDAGSSLASGVYFVRVEATTPDGTKAVQTKLAVLRP